MLNVTRRNVLRPFQSFANHRRALQRPAVNAPQHGLLRLLHSARQRSDLRRLRNEPGRPESNVHEPQPGDCAGGVELYGLVSLLRCHQRRHDRVSNESRAVPKNSLSAVHLCAACATQQGRPRRLVNAANYTILLPPPHSTGEVRPETRQVHLLLHAVPRRCGSERNKYRHPRHQMQKSHSVCPMVADGFQTWHQLPAANMRPRRGLLHRQQGRLHVVEQVRKCFWMFSHFIDNHQPCLSQLVNKKCVGARTQQVSKALQPIGVRSSLRVRGSRERGLRRGVGELAGAHQGLRGGREGVLKFN